MRGASAGAWGTSSLCASDVSDESEVAATVRALKGVGQLVSCVGSACFMLALIWQCDTVELPS